MSTKEERDENDKRLSNAIELCVNGDKDARNYIVAIDYAARIFDDLIDKDYPVSDEQISKAFFILSADLWLNPFFVRYSRFLIPLHIAAFSAFTAAHEWAKSGDPIKKIFASVTQDFLIEVYICVAFLVGGYTHMQKISPEIRRLLIEDIRSSDIKNIIKGDV